MASYRYMHMDMDGMRRGTDRISSSEVFAEGFVVSPDSMTMDMHMIGFMYGFSEKLTLTLMGNYIESSMDHSVSPTAAMMINGGATEFTTNTSGISDTRIGGLYRFYLKDNRKAHFGLGLSIPTGSIDEKDRTPGPGGPATRRLPAAMQLGSGTVDLLSFSNLRTAIGTGFVWATGKCCHTASGREQQWLPFWKHLRFNHLDRLQSK